MILSNSVMLNFFLFFFFLNSCLFSPQMFECLKGPRVSCCDLDKGLILDKCVKVKSHEEKMMGDYSCT